MKMKLLVLLLVACRYFFGAANPAESGSPGQKAEDDTGDTVEIVSNLPWIYADYSEPDLPRVDGLRMCQGALSRFKKASELLRRRYPSDPVLIGKLDRIVLPSADDLHQRLLALRDRNIDVIGIIHNPSVAVSTDLLTRKLTIDCQVDLAETIVRSRYEVVFTENFSSRAGLLTRRNLSEDIRRQMLSEGIFSLDAELEQHVDGQFDHDACMIVAQRYPNIAFVGSDDEPIKAAQVHVLEKLTRGRLGQIEFCASEDFVMETCCAMRDVLALASVADRSEYAHKRSVIVYGSLHSEHMASLLRAYGAKGCVVIPDYQEWQRSFADHACSK